MEKLVLTDYYERLPKPVAPKTEFIRSLARECNVGEPTVRLWVKGETKPSNPEHVKIISKITGINEEKLFERI